IDIVNYYLNNVVTNAPICHAPTISTTIHWYDDVAGDAAGGASPFMIRYDPDDYGSFNKIYYISPLVMDISGSGINLVSLDSANSVYWDIEISGVKNHSGWIGSGTGLLALDKNSNGVIDSNN